MQTSLADLPPELLQNIFMQLSSVRDVQHLSNTCKQLRHVSICAQVWKVFLKKDFLVQPNEKDHPKVSYFKLSNKLKE